MLLHRRICSTELCVDIKVSVEIRNGFNILTETKPRVRAHVRAVAPQQSKSSAVCSAAGFYVNGLILQPLLLSEPLIVVCTHYLRQTRSEIKTRAAHSFPPSRCSRRKKKKHVPPRNVTNGTEATVFLAVPFPIVPPQTNWFSQQN